MHNIGIMHRDLKSANIFLKEGSFNGNANDDRDFKVDGRIKTPDEIVAKLGDMNVSKVSNA